MKIAICTSRIRPDGEQTVFPPLGSMSIIQELVKHGYEDTYLFDIDGNRLVDYVGSWGPMVLGRPNLRWNYHLRSYPGWDSLCTGPR